MQQPLKILHYPRLDSTNSLALELAAADPGLHGVVVRADRQRCGRGQHGRVFASPAGGLYCSLILRPHLDIQRLSLVTLAAGVGCCLAVEEVAALQPRLKWPNDLYLAGRKLAGILTETGTITHPVTSPPVVIGIGMNVNTRAADLPPELQKSTVSLLEHTGRRFDPDRLLEVMVRQVMDAVALLEEDPGTLLARWRMRDYLVSRQVELVPADPPILGRALGLAADGRYRILTRDGREHHVLAGSLRLVGRTESGYCAPERRL